MGDINPATILEGDCLSVLRTLADESAQCVVTSPPYFGLRSYDGGAEEIGQEKTPAVYVARIVEVFREVRRVLRKDGVLWLNLGDSYAGGGCGSRDPARWPKQSRNDHMPAHSKTRTGLKAKNLLGIPWRVAFALQDDGWYLRSDCIWNKVNAMPSSVKDRPALSHEYFFLLSKSARYYYNAEAVREPSSVNPVTAAWRARQDLGAVGTEALFGNKAGQSGKGANERYRGNTRNKRTVWDCPTARFEGGHFATFPPALIRPCVLSACPEGGVVLDPFAGAGTTGVVCVETNRLHLGIELNPEYARMARERIKGAVPTLPGL